MAVWRRGLHDCVTTGVFMIEIPLLAATVVGRYLVPVLKAGWDNFFKTATDDLGKAAAEETRNVATAVWDRVHDAFSGPEDAPVLAAFEKQPEPAAPLIQSLLEQKLGSNPALVKELTDLVERKVEGERSGADIIAHTVNQVYAQQAHVESGGIIAGQVFAAPPPVGPAPSGPAVPPSGG
jgi:hypothetical protein